jgi:PAS domain S-box-containing protein
MNSLLLPEIWARTGSLLGQMVGAIQEAPAVQAGGSSARFDSANASASGLSETGLSGIGLSGAEWLVGPLVLAVGVSLGTLLLEPYLRNRHGWRWGMRRGAGWAREQLVSLVSQRMSNAVLVLNQQCRIEWANASFLHLTGFTEEEVVGRGMAEVLLEAERDRSMFQEFQAALQRGEHFWGVLSLSDRAGEPYWLEVDLQPLMDARGRSKGMMVIAVDVTEHKRTEQALLNSQLLLGRTLDSLTCQLVILDESGTIVGVNAKFREYQHRSKLGVLDLAIGSNYLDAMLQAARENAELLRAAEGIRSVMLRREEQFELEFRCRMVDAGTWFRMKVTRFGEEGPLRVVVAHEDITARKQAEERLKAEEARFRSVYEGASDAIMLLSEHGFFDCNRRTLEMFQFATKEEFLKHHPSDLSPAEQPNGQDSWTLANVHIQKAFQSGDNLFEWIHRKRDGSIFPAEVWLTAFEYEGTRVLQATVRDITERKIAEEKLRQMNEQLRIDLLARTRAENSLRETAAYLDVYRMIVDHHAIVAETDTRGTIVSVNDAFCRITGYKREELIGQNHRILNSGTHPKKMWQDMYRTVARGGFWHGEICNRAKDGRLYWVDTTIAPLHDEKGRIRGYFAIRTDITALKAAQVQAEAASRAKSEFLANMSHEIRTPMTAIMGYADLLAEDVERGVTHGDRLATIETIKRNGEHLLSIINDILDISKIEADKMTVETIEMSPEQIVQDVLSLMRVKAEAKGIRFEAEFSTAIPCTIYSDPTRLRQILVNLVGNAIKFTEVGEVRLRVSAVEEEGSRLKFEVIDTGIGLHRTQLSKLFNSFEQADASTTRRFGGSGLGLRISKRLAEMLGGDITVSSEFGRGSTFTVTIALKPMEGATFITPDVSAVASEPKHAVAGQKESSLAGMRILLAEDGPDNQRLISFHLRKAGAEVQVAENGRLAVEALTSDGTLDGALRDPLPFDLIITDIQMPEMDGYRATRLLRSKGCQLPILALTAHAMSGDSEKCLAAGCTSHLTKPIDKQQLIQSCAAWGRGGGDVSRPVVSELFLPVELDVVTPQPLLSEFADEPDMAPLLEAFVESVSTTINASQTLLSEGDLAGLKVHMHQLKGAAGGYGYPSLSQAAREVEDVLRDGGELASIAGAVDELVLLCRRVVQGHSRVPYQQPQKPTPTEA